MRRPLGVALDLVTAVALAGFALGPGCSHEARPVAAPEAHAPLPPASGSPIGYLLDDAGELELRDDQLARLREIDDALGAKLAASETALRTGEPVPRDNRPDAPRGLGFRAGGGNATVDAHGVPLVFPVHGGATGFPSDSAQPRQYVISGATIDGIYRDRARDTRDAIRRALALLDDAQRAIARRVLTEHGVDPDTGQTTGGEPGVQPAGGDLAPLKPSEPYRVDRWSSPPPLPAPSPTVPAAAAADRPSGGPGSQLDALLVVVAEEHKVHDVLTLDRRGFMTYRAGRGRFRLLPG